jgi:hypothetical protein
MQEPRRRGSRSLDPWNGPASTGNALSPAPCMTGRARSEERDVDSVRSLTRSSPELPIDSARLRLAWDAANYSQCGVVPLHGVLFAEDIS